MNPSNKKGKKGNPRMQKAQKESEDLRKCLRQKGDAPDVPEFPAGMDDTRAVKIKTVRREFELLDKEDEQSPSAERASSSTAIEPDTPSPEGTKPPEFTPKPERTLSSIQNDAYTPPLVEPPENISE